MGRRVVNGSSSPGAGHGGGHRRRDGRGPAAWLRAAARRPAWLATGGLLSAGALAAAFLIPASASAAGPGAITLLSAGANPADSPANPADLAIELNDQNTQFVTSVTVNLTNTATNAVTTLTPDQWTYPTTGSTSDQFVTLTTPLAQGQLALGTYTISVDASDATETDTALTTSAPPFAFMYSGVKLTASSTQISFDNQNGTISGTLTGVPPWGTDKTPVGIDGEPVDLINGTTGTSAQIGTTSGPGGSYSSASLAEDPTVSYSVAVSADSGINTQTTSLQLNVNQEATMVSAAVTPLDLVYDKSTGMMQGLAQFKNSSGHFVPLAKSSVTVDVGTPSKVVMSTLVPTKADGTFTFSLPSTDGTNWSVHAGGTAFLQPSTATGSVHVAVPVTFATSSMTLDPSDDVTASACVKVTVANFSPPSSPAPQLQTSQSRNGPWRFLANLTHQQPGGSCTAASESLFKVTKQAKFFPGAYYRILFPAGINFQRALTGVVHLTKTPTEIQKATESPRTVKSGGKITFTGQLMQLVGGKFKPFGNQHIVIDFQAKSDGSLSFFCVGNPGGGCRMFKTDATGKFTATLADTLGTTKWAAQYQGGSKHFASRGTVFTVTVKGGSHRRGQGPPGIPVPNPPPFGAGIGPA